jgi:hypothetical protein
LQKRRPRNRCRVRTRTRAFRFRQDAPARRSRVPGVCRCLVLGSGVGEQDLAAALALLAPLHQPPACDQQVVRTPGRDISEQQYGYRGCGWPHQDADQPGRPPCRAATGRRSRRARARPPHPTAATRVGGRSARGDHTTSVPWVWVPAAAAREASTPAPAGGVAYALRAAGVFTTTTPFGGIVVVQDAGGGGTVATRRAGRRRKPR